MADAKKVIWAIKSQLGVHEALGTSHSYNAIVLGNALSVIEELQAEIERTKRDGKTCDNCSRCKTRMANGTGCYYPRCKKHNM